jgi:hypothetical protein
MVFSFFYDLRVSKPVQACGPFVMTRLSALFRDVPAA